MKHGMILASVLTTIFAVAGVSTVLADEAVDQLVKKSMAPFKAGAKQGSFPVQKGIDCRGPFAGSGIYFDQKTGKDVVYEIRTSRRIKAIYYKGAAIFNTTIEVFSPSGKRLAGLGPLKGGNSWAEYTLKFPRTAGNHVFLRFHNTASTWFYIDTITIQK